MSNPLQPINPDQAPVTPPWSVDLSRGTMDGAISHEWFNRPSDERFLNLSDLLAYCTAKADGSNTQVINSSEIELFAAPIETKADVHKLFAGLPGGVTANLTHWTFGQAAGLAKAPAGYLRTLPAPIVADNLNYSLRFSREVEQVKAYYQPDGSKQLRALTGPTYGRILDQEIVEAVQQIAGNGDGEFGWKVPGVLDWSTRTYNPHVNVDKSNTTLYASDRDVFIFLVDDLHPIEIGKLENGDPDYVFRGFMVKNSEVGKTSCVIAVWYLRGICMNRFLWGVEGYEECRIIHSQSAPDRFVQEAAPALAQFANGSVQKLQDGVLAAKQARIAHNDEEAIDFLQNRNFSKNQAVKVLAAVEDEEGHPARSVWDVANGITAVARDIPHTDDRIAFEKRAGVLLDKVA